jgi:hypothetical protein
MSALITSAKFQSLSMRSLFVGLGLRGRLPMKTKTMKALKQKLHILYSSRLDFLKEETEFRFPSLTKVCKMLWPRSKYEKEESEALNWFRSSFCSGDTLLKISDIFLSSHTVKQICNNSSQETQKTE